MLGRKLTSEWIAHQRYFASERTWVGVFSYDVESRAFGWRLATCVI